MDMRWLELAVAVATEANQGRPADEVLRQQLRQARQLSRAEGRAASQAVFAYYRWRGWIETHRPVAAQIKHALALARAYHERPGTFSDDKLREKAVPAWTWEQVELSVPWLRTLQAEPKLWLRARLGQGDALARKLGARCPSPLPEAVFYEGETDMFRTPEFQAGEFEIQDVASQAVGWICQPKAAETWWDACAGEGGKTLHLSDLMGNQGLIWASDRVVWRLQRLKRRAARAHCFNYRTAPWDGGPRLPTKTRFDGVLVDAPCTGVGTWQRNPHARWFTTPADVQELADVQKRLLANAAVAVKPGGKLIYAACTLTRAETDEVAEAFGREHGDFSPLPLANPFIPESAASPRLWLWPQTTGGNGMFVAGWRRGGR